MSGGSEEKTGLLSSLRKGLKLTSSRMGRGISDIFSGNDINQASLDELEDLLITSDIGVETASDIVLRLSKEKLGKAATAEEIKKHLAKNIKEILDPVAKSLEIDREAKPHVILVVGVNGTGKTTTIGKLAHQFKDSGLSVMLAAGDTFRAAAVEQLQVWAERTNVTLVKAKENELDSASVAFNALSKAQNENIDVLLIDTAGRLQNKTHLMDELKKVQRVIGKIDSSAPHTRILVLDATTGQNAHNQVEAFLEVVDIDALVITKLDGTAKGGVLVALAERFGIPVVSVGVGEGVDDLRPFDSEYFSRTLMGLD
tara:strand:- start:15816 stop:16757 length:942 start_codon:yes stop_codon:yes gene_type:complete